VIFCDWLRGMRSGLNARRARIACSISWCSAFFIGHARRGSSSIEYESSARNRKSTPIVRRSVDYCVPHASSIGRAHAVPRRPCVDADHVNGFGARDEGFLLSQARPVITPLEMPNMLER